MAKSEGVCLLVDVLAHSQNEELNKATTFLLQCCVERGHLSSPPESALLERAAHIDQLLAQEAKVSVYYSHKKSLILQNSNLNAWFVAYNCNVSCSSQN